MFILQCLRLVPGIVDVLDLFVLLLEDLVKSLKLSLGLSAVQLRIFFDLSLFGNILEVKGMVGKDQLFSLLRLNVLTLEKILDIVKCGQWIL